MPDNPNIKEIRKTIIATEKLPRTKYEYQARLVLVEVDVHYVYNGKELVKTEFVTWEEIFPDDRKDNTPYTINGSYYSELTEGIDGFLNRKENSPVYVKLKLVAE